MAVGVATIAGKEYRLHYGMSLAEHFSNLLVDSSGDKVKVRKVSTPQILACIIFHGHENWCDLNDEPFDLKRADVVRHIEAAYSENIEAAKKEFETITTDWAASSFVADLVKAGKEAIESDKKKAGKTGPILSEPPTES